MWGKCNQVQKLANSTLVWNVHTSKMENWVCSGSQITVGLGSPSQFLSVCCWKVRSNAHRNMSRENPHWSSIVFYSNYTSEKHNEYGTQHSGAHLSMAPLIHMDHHNTPDSNLLPTSNFSFLPSFIHLFMHAFHRCILNDHYVPGTLPSTWDTSAAKMDKNPCP